MRRTVLAILLTAASPLCAGSVKIHGYVTNLSSATSFDIDDYRITRDEGLAFDLDKGDYPDATFRPEDLRVGTELEVQGDFNDSTKELHASNITVFVNDSLRVKRSAIVEHAAVLERDGNAWQSTIHADGQIIKLDAQTHFNLKEDQTNQLAPGLSIAYEGRRERDGSILATRFEIFTNPAGRNEKRWREMTPKLSENGEISLHGLKYKLAHDAEAQSYVQRIGAKLVPAFYEQDLSSGAARRLTFQFYLIENPNFNAHAFPNGTVLINSGVFRVLTSEAQLAAVLGHEIVHATFEHAAHEQQHLRKIFKLPVTEKSYAGGGKGDPLVDSYSRSLENQADRVGLEYMVAAGYDPREAAEVWTQVARSTEKKPGFWNAQDDILTRRSYLLSELHNNYSTIDLQSYVRDREEFDVLAARFGNPSLAKLQLPEPESTTRPGYEKSNRLPAGPAGLKEPQGQRYGSNAVTINSTPAGASVLLDGRVIGVTPLTLPTGSVGLAFIITVRKAGFHDWTGQLVSVPGRTNLRVDLMPSQ
jgi:hypothetical protein